MRNDQIFVLLLVILLPLSGCFSGGVGEAQGSQDDADSQIENNEVVYSIHIAENTNYSMTFNGTTLKMESGYFDDGSSWRPLESYYRAHYSLSCVDGYNIDKLWATAGDIIPVKGDIECLVVISATADVALVYSEIEILPLR